MIAVRVLGEAGVTREQLVRELPFRIGRDPACDVVLADASVSRVHARVAPDESGVVLLEDAGSRNGLHQGPKLVTRLALKGRVRCRFGHVELELEPLSDATTLELDAREWRRYDKRRSGGRALGYLLAATAAWVLVEVMSPSFWSPLKERRAWQFASATVAAALLLGLAAFVLLAAVRAVGRRARIADALLAVARISWLWPVAALLSVLGYYAVGPATHAALELWLRGAAAMASTALLAALRRSGPRLRFALAWGAVAGATYAALMLSYNSDESASGSPRTSYDLQPPLAGWSGPSVDAEDYFSRVGEALADASRSIE